MPDDAIERARLCFSCCDGATIATKIASAPLTTGGTRDMPLCDAHVQMAMVAGWFPIRELEPPPAMLDAAPSVTLGEVG